jgi:hypothetical protein
MSEQESSDSSVEKLLRDARAEVVWGDPPDEVRQRAIDGGADARAVDQVMAIGLEERAGMVRSKAVILLVKGGGLLLVTVIVGVVVLSAEMMSAAVMVGVALGLMFGLAWTVKGIELLVAGASAKNESFE